VMQGHDVLGKLRRTRFRQGHHQTCRLAESFSGC
jgi:hypothetical protein